MSIKNFFVVDAEHAATNTIAGISVLFTFAFLHYFINPTNGISAFFLNVAISIVIGGTIYSLVEIVSKKIG